MSLPISEEELNLILKLFKKGTPQRTKVKGKPYKQSPISIEGIVNRRREKLGIKEKISTNTISQLSPKSKHRQHRETGIRQAATKTGVTQKIMECLKVDQKEANHIYNTRIRPVCGGTSNSNTGGLTSISQAYNACNSSLYAAFTTADYAETFGIKPDMTDDIWMVRTPFEWKEFVSGSIHWHDIERDIMERAQGQYEPILIDIMIQTA